MAPKRAGPRLALGGWRQRLGRAANAGGGTSFANPLAKDTGSHLVATLLALMAWGELSAPTLQRIAEAAVKDGLENQLVQRMARSGSSGAYPGSCHRDIMKLWPNMVLSAGMGIAMVPMRFTRGAIDVYEQAAVFIVCVDVFFFPGKTFRIHAWWFVISAHVARHFFHFPLSSHSVICHLPYVICHNRMYRMSCGLNAEYFVWASVSPCEGESICPAHMRLYYWTHCTGERVAR